MKQEQNLRFEFLNRRYSPQKAEINYLEKNKASFEVRPLSYKKILSDIIKGAISLITVAGISQFINFFWILKPLFYFYTSLFFINNIIKPVAIDIATRTKLLETPLFENTISPLIIDTTHEILIHLNEIKLRIDKNLKLLFKNIALIISDNVFSILTLQKIHTAPLIVSVLKGRQFLDSLKMLGVGFMGRIFRGFLYLGLPILLTPSIPQILKEIVEFVFNVTEPIINLILMPKKILSPFLSRISSSLDFSTPERRENFLQILKSLVFSGIGVLGLFKLAVATWQMGFIFEPFLSHFLIEITIPLAIAATLYSGIKAIDYFASNDFRDKKEIKKVFLSNLEKDLNIVYNPFSIFKEIAITTYKSTFWTADILTYVNKELFTTVISKIKALKEYCHNLERKVVEKFWNVEKSISTEYFPVINEVNKVPAVAKSVIEYVGEKGLSSLGL